jgi:hypothetical protein
MSSFTDIGGKSSAYEVVPDPDMDLSPLSIIDEHFTKIGDLWDFIDFTSEVQAPDIKRNEKKIDRNQVFVNTTDADLHVGLLNKFFSNLGLSSADFKINFNETKKIEMKFDNVLSDSTFPVKIAEYIGKGQFTSNDEKIKLVDKHAKTFLLFDIIKSNSISVKLMNAQGAGAKTDISIIKDIGEIGSHIQIDEKGDTIITYAYPEPLTIGVKQYGFWAEHKLFGKWNLVWDPHVTRASPIMASPIMFGGDGRKSPGHNTEAYKPDYASPLPRDEIFKEKRLRPVSFENFSVDDLKPERLNSVSFKG